MGAHLFELWSSIYSNHAALRTTVEFLHIGGLVAGGGCAIAADLATVTADREAPMAQIAELQVLKRTHGIVVWGLIALFSSGVLLLAADIETYWYSRVYWLKMALIGLLLVNGTLMLVAERQVRRGDARAWMRLHYTATASLVLWCLTTLAGAALPNIG